MRAAFCCAPGMSKANASTLRFPTGSFSICWLVTVVEMVVDEVSITVARPATSTASCTPATSTPQAMLLARAVSTVTVSTTSG